MALSYLFSFFSFIEQFSFVILWYFVTPPFQKSYLQALGWFGWAAFVFQQKGESHPPLFIDKQLVAFPPQNYHEQENFLSHIMLLIKGSFYSASACTYTSRVIDSSPYQARFLVAISGSQGQYGKVIITTFSAIFICDLNLKQTGVCDLAEPFTFV